MQSERKISYPKQDDIRRKSTNTYGNQQPDPLMATFGRMDSFGKSNYAEPKKQEVVDWQNQSFGDSEDHRIFESKRILNVNPDGSEDENDPQNFSFCESEKKSQTRKSNIVKQESNHYKFDNVLTDDLDLFAEPAPSDRVNIQNILRRPTTVIVPSYIDTGELTSHY